MTSTDRSRDSRRHFLRRLAALVAGLGVAGAGGCGSSPPPPKKIPAASKSKRFPPRPASKSR
jgi:hypothetical protein